VLVVLMNGVGEPEAPSAREQALGDNTVQKPFSLDRLAVALRSGRCSLPVRAWRRSTAGAKT
jgi:hypothetical protein